MRLRVILGVVLLATPASLAIAQITSATISGTVKDQTGGVLPGVDIVVKNLETGLTRSVVTDSNRYFTVPGLAPGKYEARASLQGFATGVQTDDHRGWHVNAAKAGALALTLSREREPRACFVRLQRSEPISSCSNRSRSSAGTGRCRVPLRGWRSDQAKFQYASSA